MKPTQIYKILVPRTERDRATFDLAPGSAIVADEKDGITVMHYEGNVHGAVNLHGFGERMACAAGRKAHNYPTSAMLGWPVWRLDECFIVAGTFDYGLYSALMAQNPRVMDHETAARECCEFSEKTETRDRLASWIGSYHQK